MQPWLEVTKKALIVEIEDVIEVSLCFEPLRHSRLKKLLQHERQTFPRPPPYPFLNLGHPSLNAISFSMSYIDERDEYDSEEDDTSSNISKRRKKEKNWHGEAVDAAVGLLTMLPQNVKIPSGSSS